MKVSGKQQREIGKAFSQSFHFGEELKQKASISMADKTKCFAQENGGGIKNVKSKTFNAG